MAALLPLFRHATSAQTPAADAELLDRFAAGRDEDAFAELVRRHGPVVYRVSRRLVGPDAADDAFQAAFLVLATRLDAARAAGSVGGWLVGVAGRVARQMRRAAGRRARHEAVAAATPRVERPDETPDLTDQFRVLDEELARLPDRLRDPVVLCLLQGRTQEQAAAELGRDARTLRRRLDRAKQVLRARLERRGVIPAVAAALVSGAGSVSAAVPRELASRAVATVLNFLNGGAGAARSAPVVLAKGVATTMFARKVMHLMAAAAAGLVGFGVVLAGDGEPVPAAPATQAAPPVSPTPTTAATRATPAPPAIATQPPARVEVDWKQDEAKLQARLAELAKSVEKGESMILIDARCVRVPRGFCEQAGLEENGGAWTLTRREARMFGALLRAEPNNEVLTCPQITQLDNQTGFVQIGQNVPYPTSEETTKVNGEIVKVSKIAERFVGVVLKVTPQISADGKFIELRTEMQTSTVNVVNLGNGQTAPAFNLQSCRSSVVLPDSGTAVFHCGTFKSRDGMAHETIWVLTAHIVDGKVKPTPADAKRPPPMSPPPLATPKPAPVPEGFVIPTTPDAGVVPVRRP